MTRSEYILVTGGAGYIGSHTCVALAQAGYRCVILDNFSNSSPRILERLKQLMPVAAEFVQGDIRQEKDLHDVFARFPIAAVIHFAGLKAVGESVTNPLVYFDNNVTGTVCLLRAMQQAQVKRLVFSSSATVYGIPQTLPVSEDAPLQVLNPYGRTKLMIEEMLADLYQSDPQWHIARLRYFNPVGAHPSGMIGEAPQGVPSNLMPYLTQVAVGRLPYVNVYGDDYPTPDGTGVRDYIHVMDLARGHVVALDHCARYAGVLTVNLGTGTGVSVLQMIEAFSRACGQRIPYRIVGRRAGDAASCWADPALAQRALQWRAVHSLDQMCEDSWRWQKLNPQGFEASV